MINLDTYAWGTPLFPRDFMALQGSLSNASRGIAGQEEVGPVTDLKAWTAACKIYMAGREVMGE